MLVRCDGPKPAFAPTGVAVPLPATTLFQIGEEDGYISREIIALDEGELAAETLRAGIADSKTCQLSHLAREMATVMLGKKFRSECWGLTVAFLALGPGFEGRVSTLLIPIMRKNGAKVLKVAMGWRFVA